MWPRVRIADRSLQLPNDPRSPTWAGVTSFSRAMYSMKQGCCVRVRWCVAVVRSVLCVACCLWRVMCEVLVGVWRDDWCMKCCVQLVSLCVCGVLVCV